MEGNVAVTVDPGPAPTVTGPEPTIGPEPWGQPAGPGSDPHAQNATEQSEPGRLKYP